MTRVDPRQPDPRFPDRPTHPDFARLSNVVQDTDITADEFGEDFNPFDELGIDEQSFLYFMKHRVARMQATIPMGGIPAASLLAIYMDAFNLGKKYAERQQEETWRAR